MARSDLMAVRPIYRMLKGCMYFVCYWVPLVLTLFVMFIGFLCPVKKLRLRMLMNFPSGAIEVIRTWPLSGEKPRVLIDPLTLNVVMAKGFHLVMFCSWSFFLFRALESVDDHPVWAVGLITFGVSAVLGFLTECAQASTGNRGGMLLDVGINVASSFLGVVAFSFCLSCN